MGLPVEVNPLFLENQYAIQRSLRFRQGSSNNAYLNRTPASASNRTTWTWSGWVKRGVLGAGQSLFNTGPSTTSDTTYANLGITSGDVLNFQSYNQSWRTTTQVFRDPSSWYHIVLVFDTTQATPSNRVLLYVNGSQVTFFSANNAPTQNTNYAINQAAAHYISYPAYSFSYFDGYLAEVNFIDSPILVGSTNGTTTITLTSGTTTGLQAGWNVGGTNIPSGATITSITSSTQFVISSAATGTGSSISFGATPPISAFGQYNEFGVWSPRKYGGSYGTNGFYLPYTDTTSATTLCYDKSNGTGALTTPYAASLSGTNSGWSQFGIRSVITMANVTQQGKSVRVTVAGGSSGLTIYGAAFGKQATSGNAWDFSGDQVTLTFSGSTSATVSANSTLASDWVPYSSGVIASGTYVVALAVGVAAGTTQFGTSTVGTANLYYKSGDYNVGALTTAPSGYTLQSSVPYFFAQVDVQGNNWTPNNISTTPGVTYDAMTDVPPPNTIQNVAAGNYATLNPISNISSSSTISDGNLKVVTVSSGDCAIPSTIGMQSSGKYYSEFICSAGVGSAILGLVPNNYASAKAPGYNSNSVGLRSDGLLYNSGVQTSSWSTTWTTNDVMGIAYDASAGTVEYYKNGSKIGSTITGFTSGPYFYAIGEDASAATATWTANFGQQPFRGMYVSGSGSSYVGTGNPPSGFLPLNSNNLPMPTIPNGAKVMAATTYTGTSSSNPISNATNNTLGTTFQPDFVWIKNRNYASGTNHVLIDSIRGASLGLASNLTNADFSTTGNFSSINNNGFTVAGTTRDYNLLNDTFVGWQWNAGSGSSTAPTGGSIAPTGASINVSAGFSIIRYTGTGVAGTLPHGLSAAPSMVITKKTSTAGDEWVIWHTSLSGGNFILLFTTAAQFASTQYTAIPTSLYLNLNTATAVNNNGSSYISYIWAPIAGYSAFGSYTGNGLADGPFVYLGFRPRWIMIKATTNISGNWVIIDTARLTYNQNGTALYPNLSNSEVSTLYIDFLSNGFKIRNSSTNLNNTSSDTYIYAAFAESPFKFALSR